MCKALGWVGVGVKPIRACLCSLLARGDTEHNLCLVSLIDPLNGLILLPRFKANLRGLPRICLFSFSRLAAGLVVTNVTSFGHRRYQAGRATVCCFTARHTMAATIGMVDTSQEVDTRAGVCGGRAGCAADVAGTCLTLGRFSIPTGGLPQWHSLTPAPRSQRRKPGWTRQAAGQQHSNNTPAPYVLEVRRANPKFCFCTEIAAGSAFSSVAHGSCASSSPICARKTSVCRLAKR